MKISSTSSTNFYSPSFKSYDRAVRKDGKLIYGCTTRFFREDLDWNKFINYIKTRYNDVEKVNVIVHACSDGEEAYSLAAKLLDLEDGAKFLPVDARDIDRPNIERAKSGTYNVTKGEFFRINDMVKGTWTDYFRYKKSPNIKTDLDFMITPVGKLKKKVKFTRRDIFKDIKNIPPENTVLLFRNCMLYLKDSRETLIKMLAKRLKSSSIIVVGEWDMGESWMIKNGFRQTSVKNVFEKMPPFMYHSRKFVHIYDCIKTRFQKIMLNFSGE